jgi:hypothetical protein
MNLSSQNSFLFHYQEVPTPVMDPKNWTLPLGVEWKTRKEVQDGQETQEFRCGVQNENSA